MISEEEVLSILNETIKASSADQTEALLLANNSNLTRFASSTIHQNMAENNIRLSVRVVIGKKIGSASTNRINSSSIKNLANTALSIAKRRPEDPYFKSLPQKKPIVETNSYVAATANYSPENRAKDVLKIIKLAQAKDLTTAGSYSTETITIGAANSLGVRVVSPVTRASISVIVSSETSSGYANYICADVREANIENLAEIAIEKVLKGKNPVTIKPGEYTVILEPDAVADMLTFLGFIGLGALSVQENRSFMCGNFEKKIVGENITIWDDALNSETIGIPFDFEGIPKQKVTLIENGIAKNVVYDSYTANREGKESTGHALPYPNIYGPQPANLFLKNGNSNLKEMIKLTEKGILVTRFHYTNIEDPIRTTLTGMTRDGTFLIKNGEIKQGIKNLRFTQGILEALSHVEAISKETALKEGFFGVNRVPALKISKFNFTGMTE